MTHKFETFKRELIQNSFSDDYKTAIMEWTENGYDEDDDICICTTRIFHKYYLYNELTKKHITVGSKCIKQFMDKNEQLVKRVKMIEKNKKYMKDKKLFKICDTCFNKMKLNNFNEHKWFHRCKPCYIKMKRFEENKVKASKIYDDNIFDEK
tara:strand:+ start:106 stop:561 length:456 start_codon:yes stop_codon:yes gene_type:complete